MPYKAIVFDLYGTLVGNFSRQAYDEIQEQMAKVLDVPYPKFWQSIAIDEISELCTIVSEVA